MVRALKSKSYDQTLVLIVLRTLRYLAQDDRHKQKLEAEEALPLFLFHLESKNSDILAANAELLLVLSAQGPVLILEYVLLCLLTGAQRGFGSGLLLTPLGASSRSSRTLSSLYSSPSCSSFASSLLKVGL